MTENGLACLMRAVNLGRFEFVRTVEGLKSRLAREGFTEEEISEGVGFWVQHEKEKGDPLRT